jgi:ribosomal protein S12 methylthiotransferase accessory factor YcaO
MVSVNLRLSDNQEQGMLEEPRREVVVHATVADAYDGVIRLLSDAQRFGLELRTLNLTSEDNGIAVACISLLVPAQVDTNLLAARFARHSTVRTVAAQPSYNAAVVEPGKAAA